MLLPLFAAGPLILAAVTAILPKQWMRAAMGIAVPALVSLAAFALMIRVATEGPIGHGVGAYPGGVAIPFLADTFSMLMLGVAAAVVAVGSWFAQVAGENTSRFFPALTLMMVAGMSGAFLTADLFNFFVFMEVMLLPSYGLIAVTGTWHRLAAGRSFVLVNLLTSTVLLIGVTLIYGAAGNVNIAMLANLGAVGGPGGTGVVALGVVIIALCVKAGLVPAHTWLPRTYPSSSPAVMALFSAVHTKVAVYMLYRLYVVVVGMNPGWHWPIIALMAVSMLVGAFAGLAEHTMREVLAYQMVTGMPFILIVLAFTDARADDGSIAAGAALAAGIFYALHHMVTVGALILGAGAIEETYGTGTLSRLSGLARRDQVVAWVMAAMAFSIVGFPPFSGVWGKIGVVFAAAATGDARSVVAIAVIIVASLGSLLAMVRLWRAVFWGRPMQGVADDVRVPGALVAPAVALTLVSVAMFVAVGVVTWGTHGAADALMGVDAYREAVLGDVASAVGGVYK
nr:monovalent cation/H+ antiporter subunit D family protein [Corynebacterium lactis]